MRTLPEPAQRAVTYHFQRPGLTTECPAIGYQGMGSPEMNDCTIMVTINFQRASQFEMGMPVRDFR